MRPTHLRLSSWLGTRAPTGRRPPVCGVPLPWCEAPHPPVALPSRPPMRFAPPPGECRLTPAARETSNLLVRVNYRLTRERPRESLNQITRLARRDHAGPIAGKIYTLLHCTTSSLRCAWPSLRARARSVKARDAAFAAALRALSSVVCEFTKVYAFRSTAETEAASRLLTGMSEAGCSTVHAQY